MYRRRLQTPLQKPRQKVESVTDNDPYMNFEQDQLHDSIFVSIPSYRDSECAKTIEDLFLKAKYPGRIFVGVCQQNDEKEDSDCMENPVAKKFEKNIRVMRLSHYDAEGPMYARYLIEQQLYKDEMFILQLDSHMLFVPEWDEICIAQLAMCNSDKPILTTYPHDFDRLTRRSLIMPNGQKRPLNSVPPTYLRFREFHPRLKFTEQEKNIFTTFPDSPYPSLFWAAGFSFSLGTLIKEVPYDPNCPFLFVGEEHGLSMRYFTHGWDTFSPSVNIVYHLKMRTYRKTFWQQIYKKECVVDDETRLIRKQREDQAVRRITRLIRGKLDDPIYGLGNMRTIKDWEDFTGVNLKTLTASDRSFQGLSPNATEEEKRYKSSIVKQPVKTSKPMTQVLDKSTFGKKQFMPKVRAPPVFGNRI